MLPSVVVSFPYLLPLGTTALFSVSVICCTFFDKGWSRDFQGSQSTPWRINRRGRFPWVLIHQHFHAGENELKRNIEGTWENYLRSACSLKGVIPDLSGGRGHSAHWGSQHSSSGVCMSQSLMELRASKLGTLCPCRESIEWLWGLHWAIELRGQNWDGPEMRGLLAEKK